MPLPDGYVSFSAAVTRLAEGMWGGLPRAEPVQTIKMVAKKASIGFGPWREQVGRRLTDAVRQGGLAVYVAVDPQRSVQHIVAAQHLSVEPIVVPTNIVNRLIASRGTLPDDPIRPTLATTNGDEKLLAMLSVGVLLVRADEFERWYGSERTKSKWASQRSTTKSLVGRPTRQTPAIRNAVLAFARERRWTGEHGVTELRRLLIAAGRTDVPSTDTLTRMVDQMHRETGEPALFRKGKARRRTRAA
jgi:hypothetical protein